jgi:hypothetical protein
MLRAIGPLACAANLMDLARLAADAESIQRRLVPERRRPHHNESQKTLRHLIARSPLAAFGE